MRRRTQPALIAVLALAACSSPSQDNSQSNAAAAPSSKQTFVYVAMMDSDKQAIEVAIEKMFERYRRSPDVEGGESDLAIPGSYTKPFYALLDRWMKAQPQDEIDSVLSDADWVCQCQDWPGTGFKFLEKTIKPLPSGQIEAGLRFDLGDGGERQTRLLFAREGADWKVANLFSPDVPKGIIAQMTADLARWEKK